ncbi:hypothetical protein JMM81_06765 [Bacillus sp. V3B]|uniref:hypothetical protein n=1 Tax=Bacillus sp. V3B TaxID=2804915 RepID=UPI00210D74B8|nr:hypothetical protein [Bacillus sp. V3B]MCQ6274676.1 hypothetical protein [Bacillus sp. V3B]
MLKRFNESKISGYTLFIYILIYKIVIEFVYIFRISPVYNYTGLTLDINIVGFWISLLYLIIIIMLFPKDKSRPSTYLYLIFILFLVIPTLSYYWLNNQSLVYTTFIVLSSLIVALFLKLKPVNIVEEIKSPNMLLNIIFIIYILITVFMIIQRGGIDLRALDLSSIYKIRSEASFSGILGYLLNWSAKVLCPFFFAYFLYRKKKWKLLFVLVLQLLLYLSFGFKAYLFSIGMLIMVAIVMKRNKFERDFTFSFTGIVIVSYILDVFNISNTLLNSIPFRMIFVPAQIQYQYYEFFVDRDKMLFADGIIGKIFSIESPFDQPVPFVIAMYYQDVVSNSNTGIFSDAYSNGGFITMAFFAVLFALILYMIDSLTRRVPTYLVVASFSYMMFVINDNSLLTAFLTGGIGLMIILLLFFNSSIGKENSNIHH